jgi:hypothetical protein
MASTLDSAILSLSADTGATVATLRNVGALERGIFLDRLRSLNIARWAATLHRLADAFPGEFSPADVQQARSLSRTLVLEQVAA